MGVLTSEQRRMLDRLPAVEETSRTRIFYTREFKIWCMDRYREGYGPTEIFRAAGFETSVIGYKRVERCFARWREQADVPVHARQSKKDTTLPPLMKFRSKGSTPREAASTSVTVTMTLAEYEQWAARSAMGLGERNGK